ncbi:ABC transporter ATP-binding protein [Neptunicoccus cionae]|uniref:ABC transporter ATP-binding protein n=1 Tax=Neptunicoccus cionae TaxID=2035344 RepID=UPI000C77E838|nr:ABC transporter ATP-binding protein [Amylibacter cionae]PLS22918.1 ABC transporter ATP-binding protein [Amylibacter cionae]
MTANVSLKALSHNFGEFQALDDINLEFAAGEFVVLLGPSGCGKSTLLFILGGFLTPTEGQVWIGGQDMSPVAAKDRPTTTMFQDYALFPHMTLRDNVGFGLRMRGQGKAKRNAKADEMLDLVGLLDKAGRKPHELSGGQRQRVALARALAVEPEVLLLDEPLGALDLKLRRQMQEELKIIQRKVGTTFVHVTHDQEEAMAIADRIAVMNNGKVEHAGSPEEVYLRPKTLFSANFMGDLNMIPEAQVGRAAGAGTVYAARPENIGLTGDISLGDARLTEASFFGTYHRCHFQTVEQGGQTYVAHLPIGALPLEDQTIPLFASSPMTLKADV